MNRIDSFLMKNIRTAIVLSYVLYPAFVCIGLVMYVACEITFIVEEFKANERAQNALRSILRRNNSSR